MIPLAYANATPVIVANIGGAGELVEQNKTGFLFDVGDADSLRGALEKANSLTAEEYQKMSGNCLAQAQKFSVREYVDKLILPWGLTGYGERDIMNVNKNIMIDQNDIKMIQQAIEETVGEIFDKKIDPVRRAIDHVGRKADELSQEHADHKFKLKQIETMLNEDVGATMKDVEKLNKKVAALEVAMQRLQPAIC